MIEQPTLTTFNPEVNARCRALVLQAIHNTPGMTYPEIRDWIKDHKRFHMEDVGRRVRELARDLKPPLARIEYDSLHHAHVYPMEEKFEGEGERAQ